MILLIDNYDSFVYNLKQYLEELGEAVMVRRNNQITIEEIETLNPASIVISPGPGRPENAGRSVEIIEELEPVRRGPYAGAVGYFSFDGNLDSCITIRTIIVKDRTAFIQAGAGIVADSIPENEHQECLNKAQALFRAVQMAEGGLS